MMASPTPAARPSTGRTWAMVGVLAILLVALVFVMRGGAPRISTTSRSAVPTPPLAVSQGQQVQPALAPTSAAPASLSDSQGQMQPVIGTNVRDQQVADVMPVPPVMNWPDQPNMWLQLPNNADVIVALVNDQDQWMISVWHGPTRVPTGDSTGVHFWELPPGTPATDVLAYRDALSNVLQQQGRLRGLRPEQQQQP